MEVLTGGRSYVPGRIARRSGILRAPERVLVDDTRWAYLGDIEIEKSFYQPPRARRKHLLELQMAAATGT